MKFWNRSASYCNSDGAWNMYFFDSYLGTNGNGNRYGGQSVRLVAPAGN